MRRNRGFTLLELLIVIAMLAIIAVVIILIINPAETLRRGRDSQRLSDLSTLKSALALYLLRAPSPQLDGGGDGVCGTNIWIGRPSGSADITDTSVSGRALVQPNGDRASAAIDGTGWIPVNFTEIPEGSPIAALPVDPNYAVADPASVADSDFYYSYSCDTDSTFELNANMESASFAQGGSSDKESTDGDENNNLLAVGTKPSILGATLDLQVGASADDVRHHIENAVHSFAGSSDSWRAGNRFSGGNDQTRAGAALFTNLTIPKNATIREAHLILRAFSTESVTVVNTNISAENVDNADPIDDDAEWDALTRTTVVPWDSIPTWTVDVDYESPDIATAIQEVVNRSGWASGNSMLIIWEDDGSTTGVDAFRRAYSYDGSTANAPKLHIEYTVP